MHNYKITIEYDGSDFVGWQRQDNGLSIQQLIEESIQKLTNKTTTIIGAGRTDAGVHAKGQVASFELENFIDPDTIRDGRNHHLRPHPVAILSTEKIDVDFKFCSYSIRICSCCWFFSIFSFVASSIISSVSDDGDNPYDLSFNKRVSMFTTLYCVFTFVFGIQ